MWQDAKQEWLDGGMKKIESLWAGQAKRGRLSKEKFQQYMSALESSLDISRPFLLDFSGPVG